MTDTPDTSADGDRLVAALHDEAEREMDPEMAQLCGAAGDRIAALAAESAALRAEVERLRGAAERCAALAEDALAGREPDGSFTCARWARDSLREIIALTAPSRPDTPR